MHLDTALNSTVYRNTKEVNRKLYLENFIMLILNEQQCKHYGEEKGKFKGIGDLSLAFGSIEMKRSVFCVCHL